MWGGLVIGLLLPVYVYCASDACISGVHLLLEYYGDSAELGRSITDTPEQSTNWATKSRNFLIDRETPLAQTSLGQMSIVSI